ncbi:MAG: YjjI family glycine radical enzyme [Clostridia bacterium]|nr:YjjI family glycine radical enzyme [Clostridia bacterium]
MRGRQMTTLKEHQDKVLAMIKDKTLTHEQTMMLLSSAGRDLLDLPGEAAEQFYALKEKGWLCDLNEGKVTYVPRYILPDYNVYINKGCKFLRLDPPKDLYEATMGLLALFRHVPSVTHFPVFVGRLDELLEPFVLKEIEERGQESAYKIIKGFLRNIDRMITDSFCHANIGPSATMAGELILKAERELQDSTPNITLLYDPKMTPDAFAVKCIETALDCAKPSFAKHRLFESELGERYGIASCYNGLPIAGGAYTLSRLIIANVARDSKDKEEFLEKNLPEAIDVMLAFMDDKIKFLVEETPFFETNFLVKENFLSKDRFNGLFGMVGLAEAVNGLLEKEGILERFGHGPLADALGLEIMDLIQKRVHAHKNEYCPYYNQTFMLHAQVGIDSDAGISPGTRIPIGEEIPLYDHIRHAALFHKYFPSGTGDIFPFDSTATRNPEAILDIFKGALDCGMRYISTYTSDSDVIRITGYLVKRSDMKSLEEQEPVLNDTVILGLRSVQKSKVEKREVRHV